MATGDSKQHQEACKLFKEYVNRLGLDSDKDLIEEPYKLQTGPNPDFSLTLQTGDKFLIEIYAPDASFLSKEITPPLVNSQSEYAHSVLNYSKVTEAFFKKDIANKASRQLKAYISEYSKVGLLVYIQNPDFAVEFDEYLLRVIMLGGDVIRFTENLGITSTSPGVVNEKENPKDFLGFLGVISKSHNGTPFLSMVDQEGQSFHF